jgi:hypothetical protein
MAGFLDIDAPSSIAEYSRYLDSDILGKILFKSFFLNILKFREREIYIPLGRSARYDERKLESSDAQVLVRGRWLNVEIKSSHINIIHPNDRTPLKCWSFSRMLYTSRKLRKNPFDFAFAVGIHSRGLGDPNYWHDFSNSSERHKNIGEDFHPETLPHESSFLSRCGIFLLPHECIRTNALAVTIATIEKTSYAPFFAWGHDIGRCRHVWSDVLRFTSKPRARRNSNLTQKRQLKLLLT